MHAYALLIDTVRALHINAVPTVLWAFHELTSDDGERQYLRNGWQTPASRSKATNTALSEKGDSLFLLLVILNEIIIWAALQPPRRHGSGITTLTVEEECRRTGRRLEESLIAWSETYLASSSPEVRALYYFAQLHLLEPTLQSFVTRAKYKPRCIYENEGQLPTNLPSYFKHDANDAIKKLHLGWLVLHNVTAAQDKTLVWLPIATFLTTLCMWSCHENRQSSDLHGLASFVDVVVSELEKMPWPCCAAMVECLKSLP